MSLLLVFKAAAAQTGTVLCPGFASGDYCDCGNPGDCINNPSFCACTAAAGTACCNYPSSSGASGDPHLKGAHGDEADFKGEHRAIYNLLSAKNVSLNVKTEHDTFLTPFSKLNVHGSWIRAAFATIRTARTGRTLQVFQPASRNDAVVTESCTAPECQNNSSTDKRHVLVEGSAHPFVAENVRISLGARRALTIDTGLWHISTQATSGMPHPGKPRINVEIRPTYAVKHDIVA
jgi:hypothetical protein